MGPIRTRGNTRNRSGPSNPLCRDQDGCFARPGNSGKPETVDPMVLGWQFKNIYAAPIVPEFSRRPGPEISQPTNPRPPPLELRDLECVKTLGQGEYGQVLMVRTCRKMHTLDKPSLLYAMKVLRKKSIRYQDKFEPTKKDVERSTLAELPWCPFVNGAVQAFHDPRNLYLMLEFIPCGTLRSLIQKRAPFDSATAAFYFSNIVCALTFLEEHDIIHRDIKPENILVGADGYLCLADFGVAAKESVEDDWLMVGTPTYMAPEAISPAGQSKRFWSAIDWWSSGCVLYEMMTRKMPFYGKSQSSTFKKALAAKLEWPPTVRAGRSIKSLLAGLLTVDAAERLGSQGVSDVMRHPWLKGIIWNKVRARQYLAPYVPTTPHPADTWHAHQLPEQSKVPGLKILAPPLQLAHDDRFPEKHII